ncbi:MAG: tetratricopeptide repeat-containing glycosyltransferase family protein [Pirellula sp.]
MSATTDELLLQTWQIHQQGNAAHAERVYRAVLQKEPNHANGWCYLGIALHDLRQYGPAVAAYERALTLQPNFPVVLNNMGNSLRYLGRVEEADRAFQQAIELSPNYFNAFRNRGTLHAWTGRIDLAFQYYHQAMLLNPADAELHRNLGVIHLLQGNFEEGWREYDYRWKCVEAIRHPYAQPKWTGQPLQGKTVLLYCEQGLGDTIHFIRFAKSIQDLGARTIAHVQPSLLALLQGCSGINQLIPNSISIDQPFDYHCSLLDVAMVLKINDTNIPNNVPYIDTPKNLIHYWGDVLSRALPPAKLRVGISWQGNPDHQADMFRSVPLMDLKPLVDIDGVQLISLQQGAGTEQLKNWNGDQIIYCLPESVDKSSGAFMDTSAIMQHLDWIVTSDTSIAHLAGALARPTCVMLGYTPDWRWLQQRQDSPWYPTIRLFRQPKVGDWNSVVLDLKSHLEKSST